MALFDLKATTFISLSKAFIAYFSSLCLCLLQQKHTPSGSKVYSRLTARFHLVNTRIGKIIAPVPPRSSRSTTRELNNFSPLHPRPLRRHVSTRPTAIVALTTWRISRAHTNTAPCGWPDWFVANCLLSRGYRVGLTPRPPSWVAVQQSSHRGPLILYATSAKFELLHPSPAK